jgi:hypothetical protein
MNRTLMFLAFTCCCAVASAADVASARLDLRNFGYRFAESTFEFADYSDLSFLSDDLLVISINQRTLDEPGLSPSRVDAPESTIIVFDVKRSSVTASGKMSVEKMWNSVQAISGERFAILDEKGLQFCSQNLRCEPIAPTKGPMFVSPQGKRVAVGGNGQTAQTVIDTESLKQVAMFERSKGPFQQVMVIPGDEAMLADRHGRILVQSGKEDVSLNINEQGTFPEFRFLNPTSLACLDHDASEVVVFATDGKQIRRYKVEKAWAGRTGFLPTASGTRFGIYEHGYTALNSIVNFLDFDSGRPQNFQRVRVIDLSSGNEVFRLEWDPRPHLIKPTISPNGHLIARVRGGILEVFHVN